MPLDPATLPNDIATLKAMLDAEHTARRASDSRAEKAEARANTLDAEIANLKLTIAKMRRDTFGASSERGAKLLDQLEMQLVELVEQVAQAKAATGIAAPPPAAAIEKKQTRTPPIACALAP